MLVSLKVDDRVVDNKYLKGPINSKGSSKLTLGWKASPGAHKISIIIDPKMEIFETNEKNNSYLRDIPEVPSADLYAKAIEWTPKDGIGDGSKVTFKAEIQNKGATVLRDFVVRFYVDKHRLGDKRIKK